jgi:hypothetical protein
VDARARAAAQGRRHLAENGGRNRQGPGAEAVDAARVLVEGERDEHAEVGGIRARGEPEGQVAVGRRARLEPQVSRPGRSRRVGELDQRADRRGHEQPRPLARGVGVRPQRGGSRQRGDEAPVGPGDRDFHGRAVTRARLAQLRVPVAQGLAEQLAQARGRRRWRVGAAEGLELASQGAHGDRASRSNGSLERTFAHASGRVLGILWIRA